MTKKPASRSAKASAERSNDRGAKAGSAKASVEKKKLSFKDQRELDGLPAKIEALESEQRALAATIAGPEFYKEAAETIKKSLARVDELQRELTAVYARWHALESR